MCRNTSNAKLPVSDFGAHKSVRGSWTDKTISEYRKFVADNGPGYVGNHKIDCADFALFLLLEFASANHLVTAFRAGFSWKNPFANRQMQNPSLEDAQRRIGAADLHDESSGNTQAVPFSDVLTGDLMVTEAHVQVVLSPKTLVTVKDLTMGFQGGNTPEMVTTEQKNVPVMELLQGNLHGGKAVKVQRRAYDLRENCDQYYDYSSAGHYFPIKNDDGSYYEIDEADFDPRRWNFARFNRDGR